MRYCAVDDVGRAVNPPIIHARPTAASLAVTINAIVDALRDFGVRHVEMPATPERIWRVLRSLPSRRPALS